MMNTGEKCAFLIASFSLPLMLAILFLISGKKSGKKQQNIEQPKNSSNLTSTQRTLLAIGLGMLISFLFMGFFGWFYVSALGGGFGGGGM